MKKLFAVLLLLTSFSFAQDLRRQITGSITRIESRRDWADLNKTWIFRPPFPNGVMGIYIINRNPINGHVVNVFGQSTADNSLSDYSNNTGFYRTVSVFREPLAVTGSACSAITVSANGFFQCTANFTDAAQLVLRITASTGAAGSPDVADIIITFNQSINISNTGNTGTFVQGASLFGATVHENAVLIGGVDAGDFEKKRLALVENSNYATMGFLMPPPMTAVKSDPAVGTAAQVTIAAGGGTVRHVAHCISATVSATTAPVATNIDIRLTDGGTIRWIKSVTAAATAATHAEFDICGLNILGGQNAAMVLETTPSLANSRHTVSLVYYDVAQ